MYDAAYEASIPDAEIPRSPRPISERQALEREREELPAQLAAYQRELEATPITFLERRERLEWQIRRVQKRMAEVEGRLGKG